MGTSGNRDRELVSSGVVIELNDVGLTSPTLLILKENYSNADCMLATLGST